MIMLTESDEHNKLACAKCGCKSFHINMEGDEKAASGGTVNNLECDGCHSMFLATFVSQSAQPQMLEALKSIRDFANASKLDPQANFPAIASIAEKAIAGTESCTLCGSVTRCEPCSEVAAFDEQPAQSAPKMTLSELEVRSALLNAHAKAGSYAALAAQVGLSDEFIRQACRGERPITGKLLEFLGYHTAPRTYYSSTTAPAQSALPEYDFQFQEADELAAQSAPKNMLEVLRECREYFSDRADADHPSGEQPSPNEEMKLLLAIEAVLP